ncbi:MAG TPA: NAD(P)H-hydrate dehydratase, partial [Chitinophagales bacterium]|nr:NAD(P)H-hydrate dehydratase [Chitinophagales bacterium]
PACGYEVMQTAVPEVMCLPDVSENILADMTLPVVYDALAVGPGIGTAAATAQALQECIAKQKNPMVLDADALNILSQHPEWLSLLPSDSILTPHPREFQRLAGSWENDFERLSLLQQFARKYGVTVVLKGVHTAVATPDGKVYFNATGNAGMATAGSGDVLTGIIAGLLAQRYTPEQSAILGVYLHGLAGDMALQNQSMESMIASDIIDALGAAFRHASY